MTCVTNLMYHPYSNFSSTYVPLVSTEVKNRELQVDLMCSSLLFLIFCDPQFSSMVAAVADYSM
jgi:hypothetical protein